jgi:pyruvate dehydrogenase phosphatase
VLRALAAGAAVSDDMLWQTELCPHAAGEFSMAVVQANLVMEDQAHVLSSPVAALVGISDGHGGPNASWILRSSLFPHVQRKSISLLFSVYYFFLNF